MTRRTGYKYPGVGGTLRGLPITQLYPGKTFWVASALATQQTEGHKIASDSNDGSFNAPFLTLDYAIGRCTASRGDVIYVKPGYTETISNATGLLFDVAGVAVIGLGQGTQRPTLTFTSATTANIPISVANFAISNFLFIANYAAVASVFTVSGTALATDFCIENCEFRDSSSILNFVTIFTDNATAQSAQGLYYARNRANLLGTTTATTLIKLTGAAQNRVRVLDNWAVMAALSDTAGYVAAGANILLQLEIGRNVLFRPSTESGAANNGMIISTSASTSTGHIYDNYVKNLESATILLSPVTTGFGMTNNLGTGDADLSGFLLPAADSDGS